MAKSQKTNLSALLESIPDEPPTLAPREVKKRRASRRKETANETTEEVTVLVGANLPPSYARNLAMLHAETGRSKKELVQEALDLFFRSKGGAHISAVLPQK